MYQAWIIIIKYLSVLVASQGIPMNAEERVLHASCSDLAMDLYEDLAEMRFNWPQRPTQPSHILTSTCLTNAKGVPPEAGTQLVTDLDVNLCLGWDQAKESLIAQSNGHGLSAGGCRSCIYDDKRPSRKGVVSCWCTNVAESSKVSTGPGNFKAARKTFHLRKSPQLTKNRPCPNTISPQSPCCELRMGTCIVITIDQSVPMRNFEHHQAADCNSWFCVKDLHVSHLLIPYTL